MEFNGTFKLQDVTSEEVWLALSDPVMVRKALPGCQFLVEVEDEQVDWDALEESQQSAEDPPTLPHADPEDIVERSFREGSHYAALMEISVGSVNPSFRTVVTVTEREFPTMEAAGEGNSSNSSFEMSAEMTLEETTEGVVVNWSTQADVFGRIAQMGQRVMSPVANRVVNHFFSNVEEEIRGISEESSNLTERITGLFKS